MGAKRGQKGRSAGRGPAERRGGGRQRLALILFAATFVLLFVGFAIAQGIGSPSIPSGDVALVQNLPDDGGHISEERLERTIAQLSATQEGAKKAPKPGSKKYEELKETAMSELINQAWLEGQAEEMGITVTDKQVETELAKLEKESFGGKAGFEKFLKESHYSLEEAEDKVRLQQLGSQVQETVTAEAPTPSSGEIEAYYEAEKGEKFTTPESRDVRIVVNKSKSKAEAALKALEADNSPASWKKVAPKYSEDSSTKSKGGLQKAVTEELLQEPLKKAIFGGATGELIGPVNYGGRFLVLEVVKLTPAKTKTLSESKAEIESTLTQEKQQEYFGEWVNGYSSKWESRTYCAAGFVVKQCGNYKSSGHPESAPAACYEADPKAPANECPAPVPQAQPALPGTITELKPKGEPFPQRPRPEAAQNAAEGAAGEEAGAVEAAPEGEAEAEPESSGE